MITEINNNIFDYGFMSREAKNGNLKPSINWAYGPWEGLTEDIAKNISQTLFGTESTAQIPDCLTIAVKSENNTYKEYWWMKNNFVEKTGTGSGTSGSGNAPVQLNFQVITTRTVFEVPVDANGACTAEVLEAATKTPIEIYYNGNRWDGEDDTIVLQSTPEDGYVAKMEQDTGYGYNLIYLTFASGDKEPHKITDKTSLFFTFLIDGIYYAHISFTIRATQDQYIYSITNTPNVLYIDSQGLVNKVQMNVDKFNTNTGDIILNPKVTVNAEYLCMNNGTRYKISNITQNNEITNSSTITIGDDEYTLGEVYKKYKDTFLRAGEPIYITIPDTNYQSMVMISRAADMTGDSVKKYDISLSDEYVLIPAAWFGKDKEENEYSDRIQALTKTAPIYGSTVENGKITSIKCSTANKNYLMVTYSDGTSESYSNWEGRNDVDVTSYYFTNLLNDDTVLVNFKFSLGEEKDLEAFVSQVIAYSEVVAGTVYQMTTDKLSIGVDFDDKETKGTYSIKFYAKEYGKTLTDKTINDFIKKGESVPSTDGVYVLMLSSHDWYEKVNSGNNDANEFVLSFSIDENKFLSQDMEFCLWVNGVIVDYCNVGIYQKPKDGAEYNLVSSVTTIPVDYAGNYDVEKQGNLITNISVKKTASGSTRTLTPAPISGIIISGANEWSLHIRELNDNKDLTVTSDYVSLSEDGLSYNFDIYKYFKNNLTKQEILSWPGFSLVAYIHKTGESFEIKKDILVSAPGKDGADGVDGKPGTNGAQIRFLGDWNKTKYYCYLSYIKPEANERKENEEWKYDTDDVYKQTGGLLYVDVVSTSDGKYWQATKNSKGLTPATGSTYWVEAEHYGTLITDYMITQALEAKNITADSILVPFVDEKGNKKDGYRAGISNQDTDDKGVVMWAGANEGETTGANAKFKVYNDGSIECTNISSSINGLITSTNEVEVDIQDLPIVDIENGTNAYHLDVRLYGLNILLINTGDTETAKVLIDLPSYTFRGSNIYQDNSSDKPEVVEYYIGILDSWPKFNSKYKINEYVKSVNKFLNTELNIRTNGLNGIDLLWIKGCMVAGFNSGIIKSWSDEGHSMPRENILMASLGKMGSFTYDSNYFETCSIYKPCYVGESYDSTSDANNKLFYYLPTGPEADDLIVANPVFFTHVYAEDKNNADQYPFFFNLHFKPRHFDMSDQKTLNTIGLYYSDFIDSKYSGLYWQSTSVYTPSRIEAEILASSN